MLVLLLMIASLSMQDAGVTSRTVDAHLRAQLADLRRSLGQTDHTGMTMTRADLSGRTVTIEQRYDYRMSIRLLNTFEQANFDACEDDEAMELLRLGVRQRSVYVDRSGNRFTLELDEALCDGERVDSSKGWRVVRSTNTFALGVDAASIVRDGDLREFEVVTTRPMSSDSNQAFVKSIYTADCRTRSAGRLYAVSFDDASEVLEEDEEERPAEPVTRGSPLDDALTAVCSGTWADKTDSDFEGLLEEVVEKF